MKRTKQPKSSIENHLKLISKIAYSFSKTTNLEYDDLFSEACLQWLLYSTKWNPSKGKITTFMWTALTNHLRTYVKKNLEFKYPLIPIEKVQKQVYIPIFYENMNPAAYQISKIVLRSPDKFVVMEKEERLNRIENIMMSNGWNESQIQSGFKCLQTI